MIYFILFFGCSIHGLCSFSYISLNNCSHRGVFDKNIILAIKIICANEWSKKFLKFKAACSVG